MANGKKNGGDVLSTDAQFRVKRTRVPHGGKDRPPPPMEYRFPKGVSGNPGGKPKLLKAAYQEWLTKPNERNSQITNSEAIAQELGKKALRGDVVVARELRTATEGERVTIVWQNEFTILLQQGVLTAQELIEELGPEEARTILIAAGGLAFEAAPELKVFDQPAEESNAAAE